MIWHALNVIALDTKAPDVAQAFRQGLFAITKLARGFSCMPIDQACEQNNAMVKGDGGVVDLTENPNALRRWMLSGLKMAHLIEEFRDHTLSYASRASQHHHKAEKAYQLRFHKDVKSVTEAIEEMGNPFQEESNDL